MPAEPARHPQRGPLTSTPGRSSTHARTGLGVTMDVAQLPPLAADETVLRIEHVGTIYTWWSPVEPRRPGRYAWRDPDA